MRSTPARISPATYPIAATATARAYEFEAAPVPHETTVGVAEAETGEQQRLFAPPVRIVPFASLTSPEEREAIRQRAAETPRPAPLESVRVETKRTKSESTETKRHYDRQHRLFDDDQGASNPPGFSMPADALVAEASFRVRAALLDALVILAGCVLFAASVDAALYWLSGSPMALDRHSLAFAAAAILTVPLLYKLLWAFGGRDSVGMQMTGLELVDLDGKTPCRARRFGRLFGSAVSLLAAGLGMLWAFIDEDKLTWHDHISGTFPTFAGE